MWRANTRCPLDDHADATVLHEQLPDEVLSRGVLTDLNGEPVILLESRTSREVSSLGEAALNGTLLFLAIAGVVVAVVTWLLLRSLIVMPLEKLAGHVTNLRGSGGPFLEAWFFPRR